MPYVNCKRCGLRAYSAARWSHVDRCPHCDEVLTRRPAKRLTMPFDQVAVEERIRERLYGGPRSASADAIRRP
jgi:hypothetical protein